MFRDRQATGDPGVRLSNETARELLPPAARNWFQRRPLLRVSLASAAGSSSFPASFSRRNALIFAIGTSLVAVATFGATTAASYAISGLHRLASRCALRCWGYGGGIAGVSLGNVLAGRKQALGRVFAILVIAVGLYIVSRGVIALTA